MDANRRHPTLASGLLQLRLLGELQLVSGGRELALPASKKTRALLAYLVATGAPQRRDWLCDLLWEGPDDPRAQLRWSLAKIRPLLDDGGILRLEADRTRVGFAPRHAEVDLWTVRSVLADLHDTSIEELERTAGHFRGPFLEGLDLPACYRFQEWCLAEREKQNGLRTAALKALVERLDGRPAEALVHARGWAAADPLSEDAQAKVVELLGRLGRRREALAQYEQARSTLVREHAAPLCGGLERARHGLTPAAVRSTPPPRIAADAPAVQPVACAGQPSRTKTARRSRQKAMAAAAGLVLLLAGAGAAGWPQLWPARVETAAPERLAFPLPDRPSIAVLPFADLGSDTGQGLVARGLTESLVNALASNPALFVIAHSSTAAYEGQPVSANHAAEELGVRYIVEGSVKRAGDRARVTARLVDAVRGDVVWSERFQRPAGDLFALEDEITARIAASLDVQITGGPQQSRGGTRNLEAWTAYVRGRSEYLRFTAAGNVRARDEFLRALALDPDYAEALVGLANTHLIEMAALSEEQWPGVLARIRELERRAAGIAPRMPQLSALRSLVALAQGDIDGALAEAEAAAALDPNGAESHFILGRMYFFTGEYERAVDTLTTAVRINPHSRVTYSSHLAFSHLALGRTDTAVAILEGLVERWPDYSPAHADLAIAYQLSGRDGDARNQAERLPRVAPDVTMAVIERRFSVMRDRAVAERIIAAARRAGIPDATPRS